jgi:hypothetical protein
LWSGDYLTCNTLSRQSSAFASFFQLAIAFIEDLLLEPIEFTGWCDVADRTVQPPVIILVDVIRNTSPRVFDGCRTGRSDALLLE